MLYFTKLTDNGSFPEKKNTCKALVFKRYFLARVAITVVYTNFAHHQIFSTLFTDDFQKITTRRNCLRQGRRSTTGTSSNSQKRTARCRVVIVIHIVLNDLTLNLTAKLPNQIRPV